MGQQWDLLTKDTLEGTSLTMAIPTVQLLNTVVYKLPLR